MANIDINVNFLSSCRCIKTHLLIVNINWPLLVLYPLDPDTDPGIERVETKTRSRPDRDDRTRTQENCQYKTRPKNRSQ